MSREYHDEGWLLEALGENSIEEIADDCDVTEDTIERWIDKHGIVNEDEEPVDDDATAQQVDTQAQPDSVAQEGETVNRETITTEDVESDEAVVSEDDVHESGDEDSAFPESIQTLGVGVCQNCGREEMLGAHTVRAGEEVSVCAKCDDYLRGSTSNSKRTIINNPRIPYWGSDDE